MSVVCDELDAAEVSATRPVKRKRLWDLMTIPPGWESGTAV
jgi:hypothetical protein